VSRAKAISRDAALGRPDSEASGPYLHGFLVSNGAFTAVDVPGTGHTEAEAINPQGDIVGFYEDSSGNSHGFLLSKGKFTTIDGPEAVQTRAFNINPRDDIVGSYIDSSGNSHGSVRRK
jgi:probable HAF family extracellular repeat protein